MSQRKLVDANLIIRYLVQDHKTHARAAGRLFEASDRGEVVIVLLSAVLAERIFVLEYFYQHARGDIASALIVLISASGVEIGNPAIHLDAVDRYRKTKAHFVECLIAAAAAKQKVPVATFDRDFQKFADVSVRVY